MKNGRPKKATDCRVILDLRKQGYSIRRIAKALNVAPSTILERVNEMSGSLRGLGYTEEAISKEMIAFENHTVRKPSI